MSVKRANVGRPCLLTHGPLNPIKSMFYTLQICIAAPTEKLKQPQISVSDHSPIPGDGDKIPQQGMGAEFFHHVPHTFPHLHWQERANPGPAVGRALISQHSLWLRMQRAGEGVPLPLLAPELPPAAVPKSLRFCGVVPWTSSGPFLEQSTENSAGLSNSTEVAFF